ncbi:MAG: MEKHLA domain-containing protein [Nitrospirae bacterium RIFCSPLOWO2_01_FULL_62_17]|nr:MAG: MEKHLA domain-containing protein [Nitrospirae bacterium RIFCSPLOWO2_01_FULL_62_17]
MTARKAERWADPAVIQWSQLLLGSFRRWLGRDLIERKGSPEEQAKALYLAPVVVVSHGMEADPILNYGNKIALDLWELDWEKLTKTPSRLTAEPMNQAERARMLTQAQEKGFIDDYKGVRISGTGKRFLVEQAIVWNVVGTEGEQIGQAATFSRWTFL